MENPKTTKAGIGVLATGFAALVSFVAAWVSSGHAPSAEAFAAVGSAIATAIAAGIGLIMSKDGGK